MPRTTDSTHGKGYWPNLLLDQPLPQAPNLIWGSDITYLPLVYGDWAYLAVWMDLFSRKIVGWPVGETMEPGRRSGRTGCSSPTSRLAVTCQPAMGLVIHSDRAGRISMVYARERE